MSPLATTQTIQGHKLTSNDERSMCNNQYARVKFSDDLTIDILVPTLKELLEIKTGNSSLQKSLVNDPIDESAFGLFREIKTGNSSLQESLVNDQIDESAFGLFRLAFENEVYKKRIPAKLWGKFAAVGKEAWGNANGIYRDAFAKLVLNSHDE
ncbi:13316_t:CDS:1 [Ambispora gerdemannii]|uniref:13316_t:CDS:1 n=1 Tax=Ambispora gerdemannii TaxID=144530 RepID=A0A9N9FVM1_9GLOM|nr:13316_t:CDS:1 [Ambispora gerdemannii]